MRGLRLITVVIASVFCLTMSWTAHADFRLQGELSSNINVRSMISQDWSLESYSYLSGTLEMFPQDEDNILAVVNFGGSSMPASPDMGVPLREIFPGNIRVYSSYLDVATPLWYGGPRWLFRIGNQSPRWHSFVSRPPETDGIIVSNINVGTWNNQLLYLWGNMPNVVTMGVQASGIIKGTRVSAAYVTRGSASEVAADAHLNLFQNRVQLRVGGAYSESRLHRLSAVSSFFLGPNLRMEYGYMYDERFYPFVDPPMGGPGPDPGPGPGPLSAPAVFPPSTRHNVGISTRQFGLNWDVRGSIENGELVDLSVRTNQNFYVGKTPIGTSYGISRLHSDQRSYDVGIRTTLNLFDLHRISLRGSIGYTPAGLHWSIGTAYGVPHGFNIDLAHSAQATTFSAGVRLRF